MQKYIGRLRLTNFKIVLYKQMYSELYIKKIVSLRVWNIDWNKVKKAGVQILNFLDF